MNSAQLDEKLTRVAQIEKQLAALHAEQLELIAAIADDPCESATAPALEKEFFREELGTLLHESAASISDRVETARTLVHQLPITLAALHAGDLTLRHAQAVCYTVLGLSGSDAATIEQKCVPFAVGRDYTAFSRKLRREQLALDSRTVEERFAAAIEDRRVWSMPNSDGGTATIGAVLPADGAQTVMKAVEKAAKELPSDERTRAQRQADGLVRIAQDWLNGLAVAKGRQQVGPSVQITVAATTVLGLDNKPAELAGHGPIPAALARAIAADPTGTWRRLLTDEQGTLIDYGRRCYRPPKALAQFVRARDRECQFPGCHRGSSTCEIDHRLAWADGGATNADNLICLCARHHHAKHEGGWTVARTDNGVLRWTSPAGRTYDNDPARYPVGVVPDDNEALGSDNPKTVLPTSA